MTAEAISYHQQNRGKPGPSDPRQRAIDLMKRDGARYEANPTEPNKGMWVPAGWKPDWAQGFPVFEINAK